MTQRQHLLATTLFSAVALFGSIPALAFAQDAPAAAPDETTAVEGIVITGSRIPRPNLEQPTPVSTVTSTAIENAGTSSLGDVLAQLPALSSSGTVRANSDSGANVGGLSFPDLRSLGTARTLTLVNGKRHVGGDAGDTAVDLNTIPTALVDRVEVITGGASAVYGSDAVSGVINIILKDRFTGYQVGGHYGGPMNGNYGRNYSAYGTGGWDFMGGRGNVTLTVFGDRQDRVRGTDVRGLADWATVRNPADTGPNDGIPDRIFQPYVQTEFFSSNGNLITYFGFEPIAGFDAAGNPLPIPPRTGENNFYYGSHSANCVVCTSTDQEAVLVPTIDRAGISSTSVFEITPHLRFKTDLKYVRTHLLDTFSSSFTTFEYILDPDNAFITPAIQNVLDQYPGEYFYVNRTNNDIGGRNDDTWRRTLRSVASLEGDFGIPAFDVKFDASFNFGRTRNRFHSMNGLIPGNFFAAIDAVVDPSSNTIKCRKDVPSAYYPGYADYIASLDMTNETCQPFNLFGSQNTQAAKDYVTFEAERTHEITQQVGNLAFTTDTGHFLNLPGGPIGLALGGEWRRERSKNINDPLVQSGITETAPQPNAQGGFEVREVFAEFDAPILRDAPLAYRLSLNAAIRYADYSHAGNATAWKTGATYAPVRDVLFRGTYSRAVRAPNITEAFLPPTSGFNAVFDPCDQNSINEDPDRIANCAALGVNFQDAADNQFPGVTSGNANLRPEKAETWTAGFVLQPRWTPGLSLTVDWYNIEIKDAISFLDPQDAANKCVDGPELALQYCALIIRDPSTAQITSYVSSFLNQAKLTTSGVDIQLTYRRDIGDWTRNMGRLSKLDGRLTASINANHLISLRQYAFQDFPEEVDISNGEIGNPDWQFISSLSYDQGPWTLTWESQYLDRSRRNRSRTLEFYDKPYVPSVWYHDVIVKYRIDRYQGVEVYGGVNNIFDKNIPLGLTGNTGTQASYDIFGRYMFAGVRARF